MQEFLKRVSNVFSLPAEALGAFRLELIGAEELYLENHRGILSYSDTEVSLHGGDRVLNISGTNLSLSAMTATEVVLRGRILEISLKPIEEAR